MGFFERLKNGLSKTSGLLNMELGEIFSSKREFHSAREQLEELLISADLGVKTTFKILDELKRRVKGDESLEGIKSELRAVLLDIVKPVEKPLVLPSGLGRPFVILVLGVNGTGKTTTIGKLAFKYKEAGKKVILGASDTFRAAAIEQLSIWAKRADCDIIKQKPGSDPASVAFDCLKSAISKKSDVVLIDTAGRLHTKHNLMEELKKVKRVIARELEGAPDEVLLVLDATTGQNALEQVRIFNQALSLTGIVITKLDGTAKGGIVVSIADMFGIPIRYIGVGEEVDDLLEFSAEDFINAIV